MPFTHTHVLNQSVISYKGIYCNELHCFGRWKKIFNFSAVCLSVCLNQTQKNSLFLDFISVHCVAWQHLVENFIESRWNWDARKEKKIMDTFIWKPFFFSLKTAQNFIHAWDQFCHSSFFLSFYTLCERLPLSLYQSRYFPLQFNCFGNFILSFLINWH